MDIENEWSKGKGFFNEYNCPNCEGNKLRFDVIAHMEIFENGEKVFMNPVDIEDKFFCQCMRCGFFGTMKDFEVKKDDKKDSKEEDKKESALYVDTDGLKIDQEILASKDGKKWKEVCFSESLFPGSFAVYDPDIDEYWVAHFWKPIKENTNKDVSCKDEELVFLKKVVAWNPGFLLVKGYFLDKIAIDGGKIRYKVINSKNKDMEWFQDCVAEEWEE